MALRVSPFLLLLALLAGGACARLAWADGWSDARRDFRSAQKSEDWKQRRIAYQPLADYDGAECVREMLLAIMREQNAAVVLEGVKTLGSLESEAAHAALLDELSKAKAPKSTYLLMALARQKGPTSVPALTAILKDKDPQQASLAALALGAKAQEASFVELLAALARKEWQVVSAAARALQRMAWSAWTQPKDPKEGRKPAMPKWFDLEKAFWPLIDRLEVADGPERGDLISTLESITKKDYGWNVEAWAAHARGKEPDAATLRKRKHPPYMFGIPIYGRRVVIVVDANVLTDNVHPFKERARLQALCKVPGARDVPWFKIKSIKEFNRAHVVRGIRDMPSKKHKFEVFFSGVKPVQVFGKLVTTNGGNKKKAIGELDEMKHSNGNDILETMNRALDISGKKDTVAWQKGPDTVIAVYASVPWLAPETDAEVVGSSIGMKAAGRMVTIQAVGVHEHAYGMMELFAGLSGGRYLKLTE